VRDWRFALSERGAGYLAIVIVFAIACTLLGNWQLARRVEAQAEIAKVTNNYDASPLPLASVLPTLTSFEEFQEWTPVTLQGQYLTDRQVLARTRPLGGAPGFEVLTPLQLANGDVFIVDRGWLPVGDKQDAPDVIPAPPGGGVTIVARLKPGEPSLSGTTAPEGQIATIELPEIAARLELPSYTGAYGLLVSETPAAATRPTPIPKPVLDEGPHLSYAFQWFVFALLAFIALGWAIRQEYHIVNADDPEEQARAKVRADRKRAKAPDDAEVEDAILEGR